MPKIVAFEPYPKQEELIEAVFSRKYNEIIFGGGMGGGKSRGWIACLITLSMMWKGSKWAIIRESMPSLKRTSIPSFEAFCPPAWIKRFNRSDYVVEFINGSKLIFMEENISHDPEMHRLKGLEVNGIVFDQVEEINQKFYQLAHTRKARWKMPGWKTPPPSFIGSTLNPMDNWVKDEFYLKHKNGTLPPTSIFIEALVKDNPALANDADYMAGFDHLDPLTREAMLNGDWDSFPIDHQFMYSFSESKHVSGAIELFPDLPLILSFDFNVEPMTCVVGQQSDEFLWVHEDIQIKNRGAGADQLEEMCNYIKTNYPGYLYMITGDRNGRNRSPNSTRNAYETIQQYLNVPDGLVNVRNSNLGLIDSRMLCNSVLHHFPVRIHPRCKTLISECKSGKFIKGKIEKNRTDKEMDSLDAFRYMIDHSMPDFLQFIGQRGNIDS